MAKLVQVRELKNQTTRLLRNVERGATLIVTRRGKPVATIKKFDPSDTEQERAYDTSLWETLRSRIAKRYPELKSESPDKARREFERLTNKAARKLPFKTWQEADRWAKGYREPKR